MNLLYYPIIYNLHLLFVLSDGIEEIPFIKKILYENRKKTWTYYTQKLLVQCIDEYRTGFSYNILTLDPHLRYLLTCLEIQRKEVVQTAKEKLR